MICNNCGKEISEDSLFCNFCGAKNDTLPQSPYPAYGNNMNYKIEKKKKMNPVAIYFIAFFVTLIVGISAIFIFNVFEDKRDSGYDYDTEEDDNEDNNKKDRSKKDNDKNDDDKNDGDVNDSNKRDSKIIDNEKAESNQSDNAYGINQGDKSSGLKNNNPIHVYKYSYPELPDVVSLDSDTRFIYSTNYSEEDIAVYAYLFYEENATDSDFLRACDDYSILLQEENGFIYEEEFTEQRYEETGELVNYLTRDDYGLSITASIENSLHYAYISIFPLMNDTNSSGIKEEFNMPNYDTLLAGRDIKSFSYEETVNMENGLSFYIYDVIARYPGDDTMAIDITIDISSYYSDFYSDNGDFMVLPVDVDGNLISDAVPISYITDSIGNNITMPFLVSSSSYEYYTFTYMVPKNTMAFYIYASNIINNDLSGPVYVMDVGFE